ncbi:MAG: adenosine deaminase [Rhodobacteraceae bacterium]|nr:adenosine deaminase [Paracoccaceae bacterium]
MNDWRDIAKTEIHLHLEGAAPPDFIRQLASEKKIDMTGVFDADGNYQWVDFVDFLKTYERACEVLKTPEDFKRLVEAVLAESASHGVVYTELFLAPDFCGGGDLIAWKEYLAAMSEGAVAAKNASGIEARFIATCVRHMGADQAKITSKVAAETASGLLTGWGMGGDEAFGNAADFSYAFEQAAESGLGITSHAGEVCGPDSVRETLDSLPVSRIGHGVRAIDDPELVRMIVEKNIVLEVNPGSNISLSLFKDLKLHPISALRDAGVKITVSTDDPPYFHTDMTAEYTNLHQELGWEISDFNAINQTAMQAAFCDEITRSKILKKFEGA